ncbi:MAG: rRNA maturation RNase YbeY, partial [Bacteroidota bacterium]
NQQYLKHDTLTDIITFDYSVKDSSSKYQVARQNPKEKRKPVESPELTADIFISVERVGENALSFKQPLNRELMRVMIHGVLHLCGYKDKFPADKKKMRAKEDYYLKLLEHTPNPS